MNLRALLGPVAAAALLVPVLWTNNAAAQEPPPAPAPAPEPPQKDGVRFRGGVALEGGGLAISGFAAGLGGVQGRMGLQINNMIGVYAMPEFSLGAGKVGGLTGFTGTASATMVVDFTFIDQVFVGVGGGPAYVGNAGGGELQFRAGGYPLYTHGKDGIRRKGLMLGLDMRLYFVAGVTVLSPMLGIGYEAF